MLHVIFVYTLARGVIHDNEKIWPRLFGQQIRLDKLPCNVDVRQEHDGTVHVECMDPVALLDPVDNPAVQDLAREVRQRLERVPTAVVHGR